MTWQIRAQYYEACNCAYGCPCNMSGFPTHGFCEGNVAFQVTEGEREGVDLAGAKVAIGVAWPGAIHEGNGRATVFIDATEEQRQALIPILTAEDPGLPWEILAATLTELHGPFSETIDIEGAGIESTVRVGDRYVMDLQSFNDPVTGEKHEVHMVIPNGFIFTDGHIGTSSENRISADGLAFDHPGQNAYYSEVEWSSEKRMAPAPGLTTSR